MASRKHDMDMHCKSCTYDPAAPGSWRQQVESCSVTSCNLWVWRPVTMETMLTKRKGKGGADADIAAVLAGLEDEDDELEVGEMVFTKV